MCKLLCVLYLCLTFLLFANETEGLLKDYRMLSKNFSSLLDRLLDKDRYDKRIRPDYGGQPVTITVNILIKSMGDVSDTDEHYTMDCYFRQTWVDKRLTFELHGFDEFSLPWLFLDRVWKPDTFFMNGMKSYLHRITVPNKFLRLRNDGFLTYSMRLTIKAGCPMYFRKFPLDSQKCPLLIGSYGYGKEDLQYRWQKESSVVEEGVSLAQYDIVNITTMRERKVFLGKVERSMIKAVFHLQRHTGYYLLQFYVPCSIIVCCAWVSFWIDPDAVPARVQLGVTTVLTMTTIGIGGRAQMPPVSYATALDWFIILCFSNVFAVVVEFGVVHYRGRVAGLILKRIQEKNAKEREKKASPTSPEFPKIKVVTPEDTKSPNVQLLMDSKVSVQNVSENIPSKCIGEGTVSAGWQSSVSVCKRPVGSAGCQEDIVEAKLRIQMTPPAQRSPASSGLRQYKTHSEYGKIVPQLSSSLLKSKPSQSAEPIKPSFQPSETLTQSVDQSKLPMKTNLFSNLSHVKTTPEPVMLNKPTEPEYAVPFVTAFQSCLSQPSKGNGEYAVPFESKASVSNIIHDERASRISSPGDICTHNFILAADSEHLNVDDSPPCQMTFSSKLSKNIVRAFGSESSRRESVVDIELGVPSERERKASVFGPDTPLLRRRKRESLKKCPDVEDIPEPEYDECYEDLQEFRDKYHGSLQDLRNYCSIRLDDLFDLFIRICQKLHFMPTEEDVRQEMEEGKEKFSCMDIASRRIFPIAYLSLLTLYYILYMYYITDDFPVPSYKRDLNTKPVSSTNPIVIG